jgi:hypothetical protein
MDTQLASTACVQIPKHRQQAYALPCDNNINIDLYGDSTESSSDSGMRFDDDDDDRHLDIGMAIDISQGTQNSRRKFWNVPFYFYL